MDFARVTVPGNARLMGGCVCVCDGGSAAGQIYAFVLTTSRISLETVRLLRRPDVPSWQLYNHSHPKGKQNSFQRILFILLFKWWQTKNKCFKNISTSVFCSGFPASWTFCVVLCLFVSSLGLRTKIQRSFWVPPPPSLSLLHTHTNSQSKCLLPLTNRRLNKCTQTPLLSEHKHK